MLSKIISGGQTGADRAALDWAIERGKALYGANCVFCHGADARGGDGGGPNLLRSAVLIEDQKGERIAPVIRDGRGGMPPFQLTDAQIATLRSMAEVVLPSSLGAAGHERATMRFVAWVRNYKENADTGYGYGDSRLNRPTGPSPAPKYDAQFAALDAAARSQGGTTFAKLAADKRRAVIEAALGVRPRHLAYPVGDVSAAGPREFAIAAELGFKTAVTMRPGVVYRRHSEHLTALPRISLNGNFQRPRYAKVLMSGAPTALWNGFRPINVS